MATKGYLFWNLAQASPPNFVQYIHTPHGLLTNASELCIFKLHMYKNNIVASNNHSCLLREKGQ